MTKNIIARWFLLNYNISDLMEILKWFLNFLKSVWLFLRQTNISYSHLWNLFGKTRLLWENWGKINKIPSPRTAPAGSCSRLKIRCFCRDKNNKVIITSAFDCFIYELIVTLGTAYVREYTSVVLGGIHKLDTLTSMGWGGLAKWQRYFF